MRVRVMAADAGARVLKFRIAPRDDEVDRAEQRARIAGRRRRPARADPPLRGEPRFEMKFIRQAVKEDKNLEVVTLQRTAENKFLRLGVDDPEHLPAGSRRRAKSCSGIAA